MTATETPLIVARGVSKSFRHETARVRALSGFDMDVRRGEFVSLIGPSGCGKSTILRIVGGLLDPDAGQVMIAGRSPRANRSEKQFGFVPQTPALLPWLSVLDNVLLLQKVNNRQQ